MAPMQESGRNKAFFKFILYLFFVFLRLYKAILLLDVKYVVKEDISDKTGYWTGH